VGRFAEGAEGISGGTVTDIFNVCM
jgi:hypothetical protein